MSVRPQDILRDDRENKSNLEVESYSRNLPLVKCALILNVFFLNITKNDLFLSFSAHYHDYMFLERKKIGFF